jgi:hypothetical protein
VQQQRGLHAGTEAEVERRATVPVARVREQGLHQRARRAVLLAGVVLAPGARFVEPPPVRMMSQ